MIGVVGTDVQHHWDLNGPEATVAPLERHIPYRISRRSGQEQRPSHPAADAGWVQLSESPNIGERHAHQFGGEPLPPPPRRPTPWDPALEGQLGTAVLAFQRDAVEVIASLAQGHDGPRLEKPAVRRKKQVHECYRNGRDPRIDVHFAPGDPQSISADARASRPSCSIATADDIQLEIRVTKPAQIHRIQDSINRNRSIERRRPLDPKTQSFDPGVTRCRKRHIEHRRRLVSSHRTRDRQIGVNCSGHAYQQAVTIHPRDPVS